MSTVYMVGHSNLEWRSFVQLLERHQIDRLIDVRSIPRSRFPHFNCGFMTRSLPAGSYQHWAALGGHPLFDERAVKRAMRQVLDAADGHRLCLMCAEADFRDCHRHRLLTPIVVSLGWRVKQITRAGDVVPDYGPKGAWLKSRAMALKRAHESARRSKTP